MTDNDNKPYKYSPFISGGVISVDDLKKLVDRMQAEGAKTVKFTGETIFVWDTPEGPEGLPERAGYRHNDFKAGGVRPVKMCSAETFCPRFKRPVLGMALELDKRFRDTALEMKLSIGVAGCQRSCSEPATKDIGVIAHPQGYEIIVGGSAGMRPRIAERLAVIDSMEETMETIGRIVEYCGKYGKRSARLGRIMEKRGIEELRRETLDPRHIVPDPEPDKIAQPRAAGDGPD